MASPFEITTSTNTVTLDNNRTGVAVFTVKNLTRRRVHATAQVSITPTDGAKWLLILPPDGGDGSQGGTPPPTGTSPTTNPPNVRDIPIDGSTTIQVKVAVPMDAAPATYTIKLSVADEIDPDDNFTNSPDVVFTVKAIEKPTPRPFPVWIIPAIIIAIIVVIALIVVGINASNTANANATATATASLGFARETSDALTAIAAQLTEQATANAIGTATANANGTATANAIATQNANGTATANAIGTANAQGTQTALNVFLGSWTPTDPNSTIKSLKIEGAGNNRYTITFGTICPPSTTFCSSNGTVTNVSLTNVLYNASGLAAGTGNTTLLIQPSNNGQLAVTVGISGSSTVVTFRPYRLVLTFVGPIFQMTSVFISPGLFNQLHEQSLVLPTATPNGN